MRPEFLDTCEEAVRRGGALLLEKLGKVEAREKGPSDLVTEADLASQEVLRKLVLGRFPDHSFLGEETDHDRPAQPVLRRQHGNHGGADRAEYRWLADPLDGTTNFVHGVPHFCVSLALERSGDLLVAAVFNPVSGECYTAAAGQGARLDGKPIATSGVTELKQSLAAAGLPPAVEPHSADLRMFLKAIEACQAVRRTGSAALNLCYLAAGRFDVNWCYSTKIWDVAAGVLLVREAGGVVVSPSGGEFSVDEAHLLAAANGELLDQLKALAAEIE